MVPVRKVVLGSLLLESLHLRGPRILVGSESANGFHLNNPHALIYNTPEHCSEMLLSFWRKI
jgi:hypothetical protein